MQKPNLVSLDNVWSEKVAYRERWLKGRWSEKDSGITVLWVTSGYFDK